jgi:UDP-N-acetylmuramyl pentapeptide synthase
MQLNQLFEILLPLQRKGNLDLSYPLTGLTVHSAAVQPGQIFVALPSVWEEKAGGEQYVGQALAAGAQVIVSVLPAPQDFPSGRCSCGFISIGSGLLSSATTNRGGGDGD